MTNDRSSSRREFLRATSAAALAALSAGESRRVLGADGHEAVKHPKATADTVILLWMAGGMAAPETFDPKRYTPFEVGVPSEKILCTFPSIDTAVDSIKFSQGLENVAKVMDRGTLIRSHVVADLGNILHSRHQYHWHTGYVPPQTVAAPHIGAWVARVLGPRNPAIPAFLNIGQRLEGNGESGRTQGVHNRGVPGQRVRPLQFALPARRHCRRPATEGNESRPVHRPRARVPASDRRKPTGRTRQRLPPGIHGPRLRERAPAPELPRTRRL